MTSYQDFLAALRQEGGQTETVTVTLTLPSPIVRALRGTTALHEGSLDHAVAAALVTFDAMVAGPPLSALIAIKRGARMARLVGDPEDGPAQ